MAIWIDELAKQLALGTTSWRAVLRDAVAQASQSAQQTHPTPGPATVRQEGRQVISTLSAEVNWQGQPLTLNHTLMTGRRGETVRYLAIDLAGHSILQINATKTRRGATEISVMYGAVFTGVRQATLFSTDGKVLQGSIDGRRIRPFPVGANPSTLRFADNQPPPHMSVAAGIPEAINSILAQAQKVATSSTYTPVGAIYPLTPGGGGLTGVVVPLDAPGALDDHGHGSNPRNSTSCIACKASCVSAGIGCALGVGGGCAGTLFFYPACVLIGEAACAVAEVTCYEVCDSGSPCCPVSCGDIACCEKGETCLDASRGICCSEGLSTCGGTSCCTPNDTCIQAAGTCCPKGQITCNNICCKPGEVCKDGVVCCPPKQTVCNGVCCGQGEGCVHGICCREELICGNTCCGGLSRCVDSAKGLCCSFAVEDCAGLCCDLGEVCMGGKCCANPCGKVCCSSDQTCCGGICCPSGHACQDAKTQTCASAKCPPGTVGCLPDPPGPGICCPPNVQCCNGQCCKYGELCCSGPGIAFGCHDPGLCVA